MTDPYLPPKSSEEISLAPTKKGFRAPMVGCLFGGCLLPILLFFFCAFFFRDTGGLLFWPVLMVLLGIVGLLIGFLYRSLKK